MNPDSFFAVDYVDARTRFLEAARDAGATLEAQACPARGPSGEALYTDVATLGDPGAEALLIYRA